MSGKSLLLLLLAILAIIFGFGSTNSSVAPPLRNGAKDVVILTAEWCGYCKKLRADLIASNIPFEELDVETSDAGSEQFAALDGDGVPVMVIGDTVIHGYDTREIGRRLADAGYSFVRSR